MVLSDAIKYGTLSTRDLLELYLGGRLAAEIVENQLTTFGAANQTLFTANYARVRYEIVMANLTASALSVLIGTPRAFANNDAMLFRIPFNNSISFAREWRTDLDLVTHGLLFNSAVTGMTISTRETILTPLPVSDEP